MAEKRGKVSRGTEELELMEINSLSLCLLVQLLPQTHRLHYYYYNSQAAEKTQKPAFHKQLLWMDIEEKRLSQGLA